MKLKHIANIKTGQDGAVFKDLIFRLDARGNCSVYNLSESVFESDAPTDILPIGEFLLDRAEQIVPHSNSVVFGSEYYAEGDEFPLLYTNVYNNYAKEENKDFFRNEDGSYAFMSNMKSKLLGVYLEKYKEDIVIKEDILDSLSMTDVKANYNY